MKIEKQKFGLVLTKEDLAVAIQDYVRKVDGISIVVESMGPKNETVEVPGMDIHDCDYVDKFVGVKCMCSQDEEKK